MREAVVDLMSEPEIGLLDKIGLARRDWQPPRWKRKQKGPQQTEQNGPAEQKNSPVRCDLVTVGQYQLRQTHKWKKVERQRLGFIFVHIFACAPKQEVSVFRPIVAFLWCSCSYCVYSTNGLLFLPLSSPPFFSHIISMYSPGS